MTGLLVAESVAFKPKETGERYFEMDFGIVDVVKLYFEIQVRGPVILGLVVQHSRYVVISMWSLVEKLLSFMRSCTELPCPSKPRTNKAEHTNA